MSATELEELLSFGTQAATTIDQFIEAEKFPLVNGTNITFIYRGEADKVFLRCWVAGLDTAQPLQKIAETDIWATTIELPKGSRIEYKFEVVKGDSRELIIDPLNDVLAHDPFGANSVCQASGYVKPQWSEKDPTAREGALSVEHIDSKSFGERRKFHVYLPARFRRNRRYPLLVVHDGIDYVNFASLKIVLDNLIHELAIPPLIVALVQSPDRLIEYAADDRNATFLAEELLPHLNDRFPLIDKPSSRALMGASFGGVAALHAAWKYPNLYGMLLLQSGSFAFSDLGRHRRGPVFDPVVRFMNEFKERPGKPAARIYMSCGVYESLIYENRSLVPRLIDLGIDVRFEEARDAHNWENWRDRLRNGLSWVFPGPVWMVYE